MAIIDNTLAAQVPTFDPATPLAQAAKLQAADTEIRQAQFKQAQFEIGSEARGLAAVQNSPEFPHRWAEAADRMLQKGLLNPQAHAQWRNTPSPLLLKQMIAQTEDPTLSFRKEEAQREQSNSDRSFGIDKRRIDLLEKTSNPEYVRSINEAKAKPKEFNYGDTTKLTEEGGKFTSVNRFTENFRDEFAGIAPGLGAARNWVGRTLPDAVVDPSAKQGAEFWQDYDRYKNVVRNDLFGSALTATEQAAFEKADINNTMNPTVVRTNLKVQKDILEGAMRRKANSLIATGYNPQAIAQAYGVSLESLGVTQGGKSRTGDARKTAGGNDAALQKARDAIARGAPKDAVAKRLQDAGIDASGL